MSGRACYDNSCHIGICQQPQPSTCVFQLQLGGQLAHNYNTRCFIQLACPNLNYRCLGMQAPVNQCAARRSWSQRVWQRRQPVVAGVCHLGLQQRQLALQLHDLGVPRIQLITQPVPVACQPGNLRQAGGRGSKVVWVRVGQAGREGHAIAGKT